MRRIDTIIVHCSDTLSGNARAIRAYHKRVKGWSDIGYHYVITRDGTVEDGRAIFSPGAHCEGHNANTVGICLIGKTEFTPEQYKALQKLVDKLKLAYPSIKRLAGHREFDTAKKQGKTCPNFDVKEKVQWNT